MTEIVLYTAKNCPHCPSAKKTLEAFCEKHPRFTLRLVDVGSVSSTELLMTGISGTPSATLDGRVLFLSSMIPVSIEEVEREAGLMKGEAV